MENLGDFVVNHWVLWLLFFGLLAFLVGSTLSSGLSGATLVNTTEAIQLINQKKGVFIDTRDKVAFDKEHIADSLNMPLATFAEASTSLKDTSKPVIIVPTIGQATTTVVKQLQTRGVSEIYILKGGINTWRDAKLP